MGGTAAGSLKSSPLWKYSSSQQTSYTHTSPTYFNQTKANYLQLEWTSCADTEKDNLS